MENLKQSRIRIFEKLLAILIIFCMTFANFAIVGSNLAIAAPNRLEEQDTLSKGENVEFDAYFKNGNEETHTGTLDVRETQTLYVKVNVKDKVAVPKATIKVESSNFKIKEGALKENRYVKEVNTETGEIMLNNISSNNSVTLEVPVEFKKESKVDENYFNEEATITLSGKYGDINQKEKDLIGKVSVKPQWTADAPINMTQTIEKYFSLGGNGTLIEQQIKTQVENEALPISSQSIETEAPTLGTDKPENVVVLIDGEHIDESQVEYDSQTGRVKVSYENPADEQNKIEWGNSSKQYNIMYRYSKSAAVEQTEVAINTRAETTLFAKADKISKEDNLRQMVNPIGNIATVSTELRGDIYKGYLYDNEARETEYQEQDKVTVSYLEGIGDLRLKTNNNIYVDENNAGVVAATNIRYTQTKINRAEMVSLLGDAGRIEIKRANGEVVQVITNETETDEEGNIVINYGTEEKDLEFETTTPQKEGILTITNRKAISGALGQPKEVVKRIKKLAVGPEVETAISKESTTATIETKESTTEAKVELSRDSLSTIETNKNVEIKATLNANSQSQDLYANPSVLIEFPTAVKSVKVNSISKLYGDEFTEIKPVQAEVDGKQMIRVDLIGEQIQHKETGIEGTIINIDADLELDKKSTSKQEEIKMTYTNAKANQYKDGAAQGTETRAVEIVSPKGLIATNDIPELDIATMNEEREISKPIQVNTTEQVYTVSEDIINNNDGALKDVKILGAFGTKGKTQIDGQEYESNIDASLRSGLSVEVTDQSKMKVYYTENENATDNLQDTSNGWRENITNPASVKKYLVTLTNIEAQEAMKISYNIALPQGLQYNQQIYQGYAVTYNNEQLGQEQKTNATTIKLETGKGPQVKATLSGKVGTNNIEGNTEVKKGEIIRYNLDVTNTGEEDLQNVDVKINIPEGTASILREDRGFEQEELTEKVANIAELKVNETKTISYETIVKPEANTGTRLQTKAEVVANGLQTDSNEVSAVVGNSESVLQVIVSNDDSDDIEYKEGQIVKCLMTVKNTTQNEMRNIKTSWNVPEELELVSNTLYSEIENDNTKDVTIERLQSGETQTVEASFKVVKNVSKNLEVSGVATYNKNEYRSTNTIVKVKETAQPEFSISSASNNQYVKAGDVITYDIKTRNNSNYKEETLRVQDTLPNEVTLVDAIVTSESGQAERVGFEGNEIDYQAILEPGEEKILTLAAQVNYKEEQQGDEAIKNKAILTKDGATIGETQEVSNTIESVPAQNVNQNAAEVTQVGRKVTGTAWVDNNLNGSVDDDEQKLTGINVKLFNAKTNELAKDMNGNVIQTTTDDKGIYTLTDVPEGEYIVLFDYDSTQYKVTEYKKAGVEESKNSKAISKTLNIDNQEKLYGITDIISVADASVANVNLGLVTTGKFDLTLGKYISKVTVNTADEVKTYNYNSETLAKIELSAKKMENANIIIEYDVVVKNEGEVPGYAKAVVDQMPADLTFSSELNKDWHQEGTKLVSNSLENSVIIPGESKTIKLVLTKTMTQTNTGIVTNVAEIQEAYNSEGIEDTNSTPGNANSSENDYGSADVIISIKTGGTMAYTTLVVILAIIFALGIYIIRKETMLTAIEDEINIFKGKK